MELLPKSFNFWQKDEAFSKKEHLFVESSIFFKNDRPF
jgi:hypothetical protein